MKISKLFDIEDNFDHKRYTNYIPKIQYKPKGMIIPSEDFLYNTKKYDILVKEIKDKKLPEDIEKFLIASATRHIIFDYEKIAEYYCHANKEIQNLMEKSGLVIIDFEDAIENGFVKLNKRIVELYENETKE